MSTVGELVAAWRGRQVLVLGDAMLDSWLAGRADRLCREAPLPVVDLAETRHAAGGAANTAVNLAALGATVSLVAPVGGDAAGALLRGQLAAAGVADRLVPVPGRRTVAKRRLLADGQIVARFDEGDRGELPPRVRDALRERVRQALSEAPDAVLVCDYGTGAVPEELVGLLRRYRSRLRLLAVDAHDPRRFAVVRPDLVTPSLAEAARLLGVPAPDLARGAARVGWARRRLPAVREAAGARVAAVTLDVDGSVVLGEAGAAGRTVAEPVPAGWSTGAGDSYVAAFTLAMLAGASPPRAARVAQAAAAAVVTSAGTTVCSVDALLARHPESRHPESRHAESVPAEPRHAEPWLPDAPEAAVDAATDAAGVVARIAQARQRGARVVFTNGCFDVLHRGHVGYLTEARRLGDVLVVAVNSDESVRRLKGQGRPVNPVEDRVAVLAALSCVDHVVVFAEDSPARLLAAVRPDVYVKGGDYRPELIPEADLVRRLGGEVRTLSYLPDRSTSAIIERIRGRSHPAPVPPAR
jgi:D-beta-D-heptose 7-phosphate kinase/D-beta-D-heptose 1-phosphate adenosyltransferase